MADRPVDLSLLGPDELKAYLSTLTPAEMKALPPHVVAKAIGILDSRLARTPDEEKRNAAANSLADAQTWQKIASSLIPIVLSSYQANELSFESAVEFLGRVSIGCFPQSRIQLLGVFAATALRVRRPKRKTPGVRRPLYPSCIRIGTADLILSLQQRSPAERRVPTAYDITSPLIERALDILRILEWFGDAPVPSSLTIDGWVRDRLHETGVSLRRGRPKARK